MSDKDSIVKNANNKLIYKYTLNIPYPYSPKNAISWIKQESSYFRQKNPKNIVFGIELDGSIVGAVGIHKIEQGHKAEIGYWLGQDYWGRGIMTDVVKKASDFAFKEFKLKRLFACVFTGNEGSARVLEKNGYVYEGTLKKNVMKDNKSIDERIYALIK